MARLLFLTQRIPYPPNKGEKIRSFHVLQHLAQRHQVHLGCLIDDKFDLQYRPAVSALCASSYFAEIDRRRAKIACLRGLLTGEALSVTFYRHRGLDAWVRRVLDEIRPDVIFVNSSNMAPYVLGRRGTAKTCVVDLVDVDSEKWRDYARTGTGPMRLVHAREARLVAALEARVGRDSDWCTFVSPQEAALFGRIAPGAAAKAKAISNGVDSAYFDPALAHKPPPGMGGHTYVFTGAMDYPPNIDAVTWFAEDILPRIRATVPGAGFTIVGSSPAQAVLALARHPGVVVTGRVPDVRPYLAHAVAAVAPMRIARGIQNKVLEAMSMARPVVVTPGALEGIERGEDEVVLLASGAEAFAAACLRAAEPGSAAMGLAARRLILSRYAWARRMQEFDPLLGVD